MKIFLTPEVRRETKKLMNTMPIAIERDLDPETNIALVEMSQERTLIAAMITGSLQTLTLESS
jgi:hypothetical protein